MGAVANHLWQSTVVAAVAAGLAWLLGNNRASIRHWIWFAASMKFLVPFAALSAALRAVRWPQWARAENEAAAAVNGLFSFSVSAEATFPQSVSWSLFLVWLAGMCLLLAKWASEWNRVAAIVSVSQPITAGPVHDAVRRVERAAGIPKPIKIVSSHDNLEPGIVGIRRPVLVWPRHLADGLRSDQIESVIAHELSHVVRRDNLLASMHMVTSAAFWFHPIVWWIGARLIEERERACDEHVILLGQSPAAYAAGILKTCELCIATPLANVSGITGGDLKQRIRRVMQGGIGRPMNARRKAVLALAATVVFVAPILAGACAPQQPTAVQQSAVEVERAGPNVERPGPNIEMPKLVREVKPQYSPRAMHAKIQGEVLMECVVNTDGRASDFKILRSLDPELDQAALDAAKLWQFEPGKKGGTPVPVMVTITMGFTLK